MADSVETLGVGFQNERSEKKEVQGEVLIHEEE